MDSFLTLRGLVGKDPVCVKLYSRPPRDTLPALRVRQDVAEVVAVLAVAQHARVEHLHRPEPEPVAVVLTPPDPDRPKRAGWWSR